jgi:hypothetical protein
MSEFFEKFLLPIAIGTIIAIVGFLLPFALETVRLNYKRKKILMALYRQIEALPRFNLHNKTSTEQSEPEHIVPMPYPTTPFETAIFSENGISIKEDTLQATINYLIKAYELNALVHVLQDTFSMPPQNEGADSRSQAKRKLLEQVSDDTNDYSMHKYIEKLKSQIEKEQDLLTRMSIKARKKKVHK